MVELYVVLEREPVAAVGVQGAVSAARHRIGEPSECQRDERGRVVAAARDRLDRAPDEHLTALDLHRRVGQRMGDGLERADRPIELHAIDRVGGADLERAAADPAEQGRRQQPPLLARPLPDVARLRAGRENSTFAHGEIPLRERRAGQVWQLRCARIARGEDERVPV